jgi:hypothetical protein
VVRQEQRCSAGFRDAAAVLRLEVQPQLGGLALRRAPQEPARRGGPAADLCPAHPSAAAARKARALRATEEAGAMVAQRWAQAERLAPPALQAAKAQAAREAQRAARVSAAQPQAAPEVWDVAVVPQPAAERAGAVRRLEVAAVPDVVAAVPRRAAGPASVAVRPRAAGVLDAGAPRPGARAVQAARLSAAAWAAPPSTRCQGDRLAPSEQARSAHAWICLRTAQL